MKAIQMTEQGGPEVLQLVELPDPQPGPGEVLIKVDAAAVNFSDLMRRRGDVYPVPTPVPFVPGAEAAGTVAAVGEGVDLPVGTLFCILTGPTRGRQWSNAAARTDLRDTAVAARVRRRFAPHQLRHAHAVELAREGVPLTVIQRQLGHSHLGITSVYLQGIDNAEIIDTIHARRAPMIPVSTSLRLQTTRASGAARRALRKRQGPSFALSARNVGRCRAHAIACRSGNRLRISMSDCSESR